MLRAVKLGASVTQPRQVLSTQQRRNKARSCTPRTHRGSRQNESDHIILTHPSRLTVHVCIMWFSHKRERTRRVLQCRASMAALAKLLHGGESHVTDRRYRAKEHPGFKWFQVVHYNDHSTSACLSIPRGSTAAGRGARTCRQACVASAILGGDAVTVAHHHEALRRSCCTISNDTSYVRFSWSRTVTKSRELMISCTTRERRDDLAMNALDATRSNC